MTQPTMPSCKVALPEVIQPVAKRYLFDSSVMQICIESLLRHNETKELMKELLKAATLTTHTRDLDGTAADRWLDPHNLLKPMQFETRTAGNMTKIVVSSGAADRIETLIDLYKVFNSLPGGTHDNDDLSMLSPSWRVALGIIYSLTAITSFLLNVFTVIVLSQQSQKGKLRMYLINLSLSDLLMSCFSIPVTYTEWVFGSWVLPRFLCPITRLVVTLCVFVSTATMIGIGLNRRQVILNPLEPQEFPKILHWRIKHIHVILAIWLLGLFIAIPEFLMFSALPFCFNRKLHFDCHTIWPDPISDYYTIFIFLSTFLIPLSMLSRIYIKLSRVMWNHSRPGNELRSQTSGIEKQRNKVSKMLLAVVVGFAIFWTPIQVFQMVVLLFPELYNGIDVEDNKPAYNRAIALFFTCHWLSMAHSLLNPLIYGLWSRKFRNEFKKLCCTRSGQQKGRASSTLAITSCSTMFDDRGASLQRPLRSQRSNAKANGVSESADSCDKLGNSHDRGQHVEHREDEGEAPATGRGRNHETELVVVAEYHGRSYSSRLATDVESQTGGPAGIWVSSAARPLDNKAAVGVICHNHDATPLLTTTTTAAATIPIIGTLHEEVEETDEEGEEVSREQAATPLDSGQDVALGMGCSERVGAIRTTVGNYARRTKSELASDFRHRRRSIRALRPDDETGSWPSSSPFSSIPSSSSSSSSAARNV